MNKIKQKVIEIGKCRVYPMKTDWAFQGRGIISDGYKTKEEAIIALARHLDKECDFLLTKCDF